MNNMERQNLLDNEYATRDLYFAAFLQVKGLSIQKLEQYGRDKRGKDPCYFIFDNRDECERLEDVFWNGRENDVLVNAKDYFSSIRDLRSRVFSITKLVQKTQGGGYPYDNNL